jgi:hypothetical protein
MRAQREISFDDVFDQIREQQIEVAKLADDNPFKPLLHESKLAARRQVSPLPRWATITRWSAT